MSSSRKSEDERTVGHPGSTAAVRLGRRIRRRWRCLSRRWSHHGVHFVYGSGYVHPVSGVPMDPARGERILAFLSEEGLIDREDLVAPREVSIRNLLRVHTPDYLDALQRTETLLRILGVPVDDHSAQKVVGSQRLMAGGTLQASRLARRGRGVVVNLGGGLHHAHRDSGMAFCVFNDIAVAVARLRTHGFGGPVLIVDLDMHDGNGTRSIFAHDPSVHTYSIHNEHWGETDVTESTSIALGSGVGDEQLLGTLVKTLPPIVESVEPEMVFYIAGTDASADDPLGNWDLSAEGMLSRDQFVFTLFRRRPKPVPMVVLLGGGYGERSWRYSARFLSLVLRGRAIEPPLTEEMTLTRFRAITGTLDPASLTAEPGDFSWRLTEDDLVGIVPGGPRKTRFLSYFSTHGVELALERYGVLNRLRLLGFEHPTIDLDLDEGIGETLRIWARPDRKELVVELRLDRSRRAVAGFEVLTVEWLLLQNPRAKFGPFRRPLPGQKHPGLGLLKEIFGFEVMVCEILSLDGIFFVPSSYHVAAQSRRVVYFLEPRDEALFEGLQDLLGNMPLAEASSAVAEGRVRDAEGEVFEWEGLPMVLPVSEMLKERVSGPTYQADVEAAADDFRFELDSAEE
ncbi:MAG: histone deacetylase [Acidobacteriota bacterium]